MDIKRIIEILDTLPAADLRQVHERATELVALHEHWQNPDQAERKPTYKQEYTKCNKPGCKTCSTGQGHGPYWYAYWSENGRTRKEYIGKMLPETAQQAAAAQELARQHRRELQQAEAIVQEFAPQLAQAPELARQHQAAAQKYAPQIAQALEYVDRHWDDIQAAQADASPDEER